MFRKLLALAGAFLFASTSVKAVEPATGLWWNPSESGRGFNLDYQNGYLIVTGFVYNPDGSPTFVQAAGPYNTFLSHFSAQLASVSGGQCLGCTYRAPTPTILGTLTLDFTSTENARISFPGGSDQIQHEIYGYSNQMEYLYGEWSFEYQILGSVFTEWVIFNGTYTSSDGTHYISGGEDSRSNTSALGALSNGEFIIAVGDGSFTDLYEFPIFDDRRMIGHGDIFSTGETVTDPKYIAFASRLFARAELSQSTSSQAREMFHVPTYGPDPKLETLAAAIQARVH